MASTESHKKSVMKWKKKNYKRIPFDVSPEYKEKITAFAKSHNMTLSAFIRSAIDEKIERMQRVEE